MVDAHLVHLVLLLARLVSYATCPPCHMQPREPRYQPRGGGRGKGGGGRGTRHRACARCPYCHMQSRPSLSYIIGEILYLVQHSCNQKAFFSQTHTHIHTHHGHTPCHALQTKTTRPTRASRCRLDNLLAASHPHSPTSTSLTRRASRCFVQKGHCSQAGNLYLKPHPPLHQPLNGKLHQVLNQD